VSDLDSQLKWALAWQLVTAAERGVTPTQLQEFDDPIDGRTLLLTSDDHPCELVLNGRRGVTIIAPILIETLPWPDVATRQLSVLAADVRATLAWPSQASWSPSTTQIMHGVISRLLAAGLPEEPEYWVCSASATDSLASRSEIRLFPTFEDQMLDDFERQALEPQQAKDVEAWILWREATPLAVFDSAMGMHTATSRWSYRDLSIEVGACPRRIAHHCLDVLTSIAPSAKIFLLR